MRFGAVQFFSPPTFIDFPHDSDLQVLPVVLFAVETQQDTAELRRQPKRWHHVDVTERAQTGWQFLYCCYSLLWILKTQHVDHWGWGGSEFNKKQFNSSWQCEHVNPVQIRWNQINDETFFIFIVSLNPIVVLWIKCQKRVKIPAKLYQNLFFCSFSHRSCSVYQTDSRFKPEFD